MHICLYFHDYIEDSLEYSNGYKFTTKDQDNDGWSGGQCAHAYRGAWWYYNCHPSNLNGLYLGGVHTTFADGIAWIDWTGFCYSLKSTKMMIRRN
jgi:ficolin